MFIINHIYRSASLYRSKVREFDAFLLNLSQVALKVLGDRGGGDIVNVSDEV